MLRVLVIVVALTGIVRADPNVDARKLNEVTLARYDREISDRNPLLKLYDLLDDARITNCKHARENFLEAKRNFDKVPKDDEPELYYRLHEMEQTAKGVDRVIDAYRAEAKTTMLKVVAGLALGVILLFGGAIWALIKRRGSRLARR